MRTPESEPAKRLAALYRRKLTTPWSEKEVRQFRCLVKDKCFEPLDDLALIERYYAFERKKPAHGPHRGTHRRDLYTLLNNWHGELDRAREWAEAHPIVKPRKIIPLPSTLVVQSDLPIEQVDPQALEKFKAELAERKARRQG